MKKEESGKIFIQLKKKKNINQKHEFTGFKIRHLTCIYDFGPASKLQMEI